MPDFHQTEHWGYMKYLIWHVLILKLYCYQVTVTASENLKYIKIDNLRQMGRKETEKGQELLHVKRGTRDDREGSRRTKRKKGLLRESLQARGTEGRIQ